MFIDEKLGVGIRAVEFTDLPFLKDLRNDPTTWYYLSDISMLTQTGQEHWYEKLLTDRTRKYFIIFDSIDKQSIGMVRCDEIDHINRSIRIGMDIHPSRRGKGIATNTYVLLLRYCFDYLNMHRVWLEVLDFNTIGHRLYSNVGFKEEGRLRDAIFRNGCYHDYIVMSVLENEYRAAL